MRWQRIARLAIAVFVVGFGAFVFLAMRQRVTPPSGSGNTANVDPEVVLSSGAGLHEDRRFGKLYYSLKYNKQLTYKSGRSTFIGVTLTLPDRNGRTFLVIGDEAELLAPPEKPAEISGAKVTGHVKLTTDNGVEVLASEATFDEKEGIVRVPGPVTFTRGRMKGSGVGATYDRNRDVLWLLAEAHLTVTPDAAGGGAVEATASTAGLARAENFAKLVGSARMTADARTAEADEITALLDEKGREDPAAPAPRAQPDHRHRRGRAEHDRQTHRHDQRGRRTHAAELEADGGRRRRVPRRGRRAGPANHRHHDRDRHVARRGNRHQPDSSGKGPGRSAGGRGVAGQKDPLGVTSRHGGPGAGVCRTPSSKAASTTSRAGRRPPSRRRSNGTPPPPASSSTRSRGSARSSARTFAGTRASSTASSPPRRRAPSTTSSATSSISRHRTATPARARS